MALNFIPEREKIWQQIQQTVISGSIPNESLLLSVFEFQYNNNPVYNQFCKQLQRSPATVSSASLIPFLPISAFKYQRVTTGAFQEEFIFTSSGTSSTGQSRHYVRSLSNYLDNCSRIWERHFGNIQQYCYLALLPGYLEREGSSLITMTDHFIRQSGYHQSGFYLRNHEELTTQLIHCREKKIPTVLLGVSYALLDFLEDHPIPFPELIVMETGGMKGKREEISKTALHDILKNGFQTDIVYSEYGMTELLSQAYSLGNQSFQTNSSFQVRITEINDPFAPEKNGKTGILNITDLANLDSCCFIQTEDIARAISEMQFEVIGRLDASELRGCNLLLEEVV